MLGLDKEQSRTQCLNFQGFLKAVGLLNSSCCGAALEQSLDRSPGRIKEAQGPSARP